MKSLIPFPDTEAFPAKNGSGYRSMAVIFAGFHTLPIYPLKTHYHGNEVYRTAGDDRTGITERNNPCPPNGSGGTAKGEKYEKIPCTGILFPEHGTVPPYPAAYGKTARTAFRDKLQDLPPPGQQLAPGTTYRTDTAGLEISL
jgi:hypothetical protein